VEIAIACANALHRNHFLVLAHDSLERNQGSKHSVGALSSEDPFRGPQPVLSGLDVIGCMVGVVR
jgi:hypothetical protein